MTYGGKKESTKIHAKSKNSKKINKIQKFKKNKNTFLLLFTVW